MVEFGYRVFWGYVSHTGDLTAAQHWFVSLAGTLGSLAFGLVVWLLLRRNPSRTWQYFGLRAFRFQIYFSLLYYPLFSFILPIGDWRTIYNFGATPILSGAALVIHAALLLWFWRADRVGAFEMTAFDTVEQERHYAALTASGDLTVRLQAIEMLRQGGSLRQAQRELDAFLADNPNSAEAHLQRALMLGTGRGANGNQMAAAARQAAALGLRRPADAALAHRLAALHELERGDGRAAEAELDAALMPTPGYDPEHLDSLTRADLHQLRGQAYRRQARYDDAHREVGLALELAAAGPPAFVAHLRDEQLLIAKHAGSDWRAPETLPSPPEMS